MATREDFDLTMGAERFEVPRSASNDEDTDDSTQAIVQRAIEQAIHWREEHLDEKQETATDYYHARPFGNEKEGRSQVVATDVRDVVASIMPSLLRIFFGSEKVVEYRPDRYENAQMAQHQTDYVQYIIREDNPGFMSFYSAFKDALVRKMGVIKFWWDDVERVEGDTYTGLTQDQVDALLFDSEDVEEVDVQPLTETVFREEEDLSNGEVIEVEAEAATFEVTLRRRIRDGRVRVAAIPPEEFIFSPGARSVEEATMVGHVRDVPADELIGMGVDPDLVEKHKGRTDEGGRRTGLKQSRQIDQGAREWEEDEQDEATRPIRCADIYIRLDEDGDGIAELRHIRAIGDSAEIVSNEPTSFRPFALFGPDPEPHTMVGLSVADYVMDLQEINSKLLRGMLDSLSQHLDPATEVVDGEVNMKDLLNPEPNRIVRVRKPGMMREVASSFVGGAALPVLQWMQEVRENRVGISKAAAGLDADALQSSTKAAVAATLSASQQRIETIARIFAETGMTDLFTGILKLIVQNQDFSRQIRVAGEWVEMDPREWTATKDVTVNVALGAGLTEEKLQALALIAEKQEQMLQMGVPLVSFQEYRNTLARMTELAGFGNSQEFWKTWSAEDQQQYEQMQAEAAQNEQGGDEATQALVQVEMAKIQSRSQEEMAKIQAKQQEQDKDLAAKQAEKNTELSARQQIEQARMAMEQQKAAMQDERERLRIMLDYQIKLAQLDEQAQKRAQEGAAKALDLNMKAAEKNVDIQAKTAKMLHELQDMDVERIQTELDVAERMTPDEEPADGPGNESE